jgi:sec-independent protein translocase protein TatA
MFGFGLPELAIIAVILLIVFGAGRLPELGQSFGRSIRNFREASRDKEPIEIKRS